MNVFSGARGYYNANTYFYGTAPSIRSIIGARYSGYGYVDAFEFRPIQYMKSWGDMTVTTYNDYESLGEAFPDLFGGAPLSRITAEEYWEHLKDE